MSTSVVGSTTLRAAWLAFVLSIAFACNPVCDTRSDADEATPFTDGRFDATRTFYETNAFDEPYLFFPPGRRYEIVHGLRDKPRHIGIFVAFVPDPLSADTRNNTAPAAGNQAVIEKVDERVVWIRNDTCADFYLRVELSTFPNVSAGGAGGSAGAAGG